MNPLLTSTQFGCDLSAPTMNATVIKPSVDTPYSTTLNVPFQSSNHASSVIGIAHHWKPTPVSSCNPKHAPPISDVSTRKSTMVSATSGTTKKLKPNRSRTADGNG